MARKRKPYWHKTDRWCFTVTTPDGKRRTVYDRAGIRKTEKAAAREWMETTLEAMEERKVVGGEYTVNDLRLMYLTWAEKRVAEGKLAPVTFEGHRKQLRRVCRAEVGGKPFGARLARELKPRDVKALQEVWADLSPTTIRNRLASLLAALNWASQARDDRAVERLIPSHPLADVELPKAVAAEGRYSPSQEVDAFLAFVDRWAAGETGHSGRFARMTAILIRVAAETGCRPGELCAACWDHFRPDERSIVLPPGLQKTGRKTKRSRVIVLPPALVARVAALKDDPDRHPDHVFTHRTHSVGGESGADARRQGAPWNSSALSRRVKELRRAAIAAGVLTHDSGVQRLHLYKLRHTYATNAVQSGESIADVAGLIGNSAKITEQVYLHRQIGHLQRVADRVAGKGGEAPPQ